MSGNYGRPPLKRRRPSQVGTLVSGIFRGRLVLALVPLFFIGVVFGFVFAAPVAWIVMLVLGAVHATYPAVPALSFWLTWITVFAAKMVLSDGPSVKSDQS